MAPEPFETTSDDGSKVFVFTPARDGMGDAHAAVYEIINSERQLVYTVENLSSFAYESNFHFSSDMMHFARVFPEYGMSAFEVFSYGIRTRAVMRNDFIENYASIKAETSIGPEYTVTWSIVEHLTQNTMIAVYTNEGKTAIFNLETAEFLQENGMTVRDGSASDVSGDPISNTQTPGRTNNESSTAGSSAPVPHSRSSLIITLVVVGAAVTLGTAAVLLVKKQ